MLSGPTRTPEQRSPGVTMQWLPTELARLRHVFPEPSELWKHTPPPRSSQGDRLPRRHPCPPALREQRPLLSSFCRHACDRSSETQPRRPASASLQGSLLRPQSLTRAGEEKRHEKRHREMHGRPSVAPWLASFSHCSEDHKLASVD